MFLPNFVRVKKCLLHVSMDSLISKMLTFDNSRFIQFNFYLYDKLKAHDESIRIKKPESSEIQSMLCLFLLVKFAPLKYTKRCRIINCILILASKAVSDMLEIFNNCN